MTKQTSAVRFDEVRMVLTRTDDGGTKQTELRWSEVSRVVAYKRDCYAIDLICIAFSTAAGAVEVNEEMEGWDALTDALPMLLPGTPDKSQWWQKVAQPPFATNATALFSR
jgi:hypothetical protein